MAKSDDQASEDWTFEVQQVLLAYLITDADCYARSRTIIKPDYFDDTLRKSVRFILDYTDKHHALPIPQQIKAIGGLDIQPFPEANIQHAEWFLGEIERFCRYKALEQTLFKGLDLLEKGRFGEYETMVKEAMTISLASDLGTDYFADPLGRLERARDRSSFISTGWESLDKKLFGGFTRGALNIFAGGRGVGKSLILQNVAINYAMLMKMNVVYISLELAEDLVAQRLDSMLAGVPTFEIFKNMSEVALKVRQKGRGAGSLMIKRLPEAGTTANTIRAYLREYEIKTGIRPDVLLVDYLDLMYPVSEKIDPSDQFIKDKYVSEELRSLSHECQLITCTASQLNRGSVETETFNQSHIAGGISKVNTADNLIGLFQSQTMKESGRYQFQFLKTRTSNAVGSQLDMSFDRATMRIFDLDPNEVEMIRAPALQIRGEVKQRLAGPPPRPAALTGPVAGDTTQRDKMAALLQRSKRA